MSRTSHSCRNPERADARAVGAAGAASVVGSATDARTVGRTADARAVGSTICL
ncbi:MAG TPA: hypothetical protein VEY90_04495 [Thermoleophilaceae bacterium]|nr:hypothetical protein [Thermoleophilaceae bacterium]